MWNRMVGETFYPWPPGTHATPLCKLEKKNHPTHPWSQLEKGSPLGRQMRKICPFFANTGPHQDPSLVSRVHVGWILAPTPALECPLTHGTMCRTVRVSPASAISMTPGRLLCFLSWPVFKTGTAFLKLSPNY